MHHGLVRDLLRYALVVVVLSFVHAVTQHWVEQRYFAGPRLDEWRQARRQLRGTGQPRVIWATSRNRPVSRATLTGAQLAYVRYRQDMARRAPRWLRPAVPAILGVLAAGCAALAVARSQQRAADSVMAAAFVISGLSWWLALPWWFRHLTERLARLQAEIERAAGMPPQDSEMP